MPTGGRRRPCKSIRAEFTASNETIAATFREDASPLFLALADLLLREGETDATVQRSALVEARDAVELLKTVELQDYFQDDCVSLARSRVQGLEQALSRTPR